MPITQVLMFLGFVLAAYSIVANDAIQTLGTFLSSNSKRPWWALWLYACSILVAVMVYGWLANLGDVSYGRLEKFPEPVGGIRWIHIVPPLFILLLTRYGVPVSTTFLVLTVFAPANLSKILVKSLSGYGVAMAAGLVLYLGVIKLFESRFLETKEQQPTPTWIALQWLATAFLWSQWLIQDLANIFVYLPRRMGAGLLIFAVVVMLGLHAMIFRSRGGKIQDIVSSKTNTSDVRAATLIDFSYALILMYFKEVSNIPMSTTWVFLGLLAGREIAFSLVLKHRTLRDTLALASKDVAKAGFGLAVSVALALGLPALEHGLTGVARIPRPARNPATRQQPRPDAKNPTGVSRAGRAAASSLLSRNAGAD